MVKEICSENCKICGKLGHHYFELKYSSVEIVEYFKSFYGVAHSDILNDYLRDKKFSILKCFDCNFIWQKFIPNEEFSNLLYEKIIDKDISFNKSKNLESLLKKKNKFKFNAVFNYFHKKKLNVLDFGAGWGSWLLSLDQNKANIFAYEISNTRKDYLIKNGINVLDENQIEKLI